MPDRIVSSRQFSFAIVLFTLGSSLVTGVNKTAKQDSWISLILALFISVPVIMMYARIIKLFPGKNLGQIITEVFGRILGIIMNLLMTFYALYLGGLVIRNFSEFIQVMSMPETPQIPLMILMVVTTMYMAKSGMKVITRWSVFFLPIIILTVIFTVVFTMKDIDLTYLEPVLSTGYDKIIAGSFHSISFPIAETVLFLYTFDCLKKGDSPYKAYYWGIGISGLILLLALIRNITALGVPMVEATYFPSYVAAKLINVGDFLTRMEGTIAVNLILSGIVKISVCMLAASNGLMEIFRFKDAKSTVVPAGLIMLLLCVSFYKNIMEMFEFITVYFYFAFPFQIVLPLIIWIGCEIKTRGIRRQSAVVMGV